MFSALPLSLLLFVSSVNVFAAPQSTTPNAGLSMTIKRRAPTSEINDLTAWTRRHRAHIAAKYGTGASTDARKRSSGPNLLVNQGLDSSYYGSIAIGTPAVSYNVILDTGSSDLWLAGSTCSNCDSIPTFRSSSSTSFQSLDTPFEINYGLGFAQGTLAKDTVQMAGFSVANQTFAVCDTIAEQLINQPVSGLMGLAFNTIATSQAIPFWQALANGKLWDSPVMAFQLTRYGDSQAAQELEPGGTFTMGSVNNSLFTGEIDFQPMPSDPTYWLQSLSSITINGNSVPLSGGNTDAAIDTGTTLIGGPQQVVAAIYAQIPGSQAETGKNDGYFTYPCNTRVTVTMAFGGKSWTMNPTDFIAMSIQGTNQCVGAFFVNPAEGSAPAWIVGDAFLKNVYSVFRFDPPAVGFAELSDVAINANGADLPVPEPTIGAIVASTTASSDPGLNREHSGARSTRPSTGGISSLMVSGLMGGFVMGILHSGLV